MPSAAKPQRVAIVTKAFAQSNNDYSMPPLIDLVRSLTDRLSITVYALNYPYERRTYDLFGARVHAFGLGRMSGLAALPILRRQLMRDHASNPFDLIHAVWADQPATLAMNIARRLKCPLVTSLYAGEAVWLPEIGYGSCGQQKHKDALTRVLAGSEIITAGSRNLAHLVHERFGSTVRAVPLGYDARRFGPDGPRDALGPGRHIVTAASLGAVKGLDRLVAALQTLSGQRPDLLAGTTWHIVGPDPRDDALRRKLSARIGGLPIRLHQARPHWEMAALYRAADLALLTSHFESQCFAAIEAAACGTPVMGTAVGILPEMVSDEWLCPPESAAALPDVIAQVLDNPQGWAGECARQQTWLHSNARLEIARDRFLNLYQDACYEERVT